MPELPEVETVKNRLIPFIKGKTIKSVDVFYSKYDLIKDIKNETINDIKRKGKYLIFVLDNYYMISHLRMEGKYFIVNSDDIKKHDLVRFKFDDFNLIYNDVRKFGVFYLFNKNEDIYSLYPLAEVGDEPFYIKKETLIEKLKNKKEPIKTCLLDQSIISGLGNIYVDEVLYLSKVNPYRSGSSIDSDEIDKIIKNSINVLNKAIEAGGSTIKSFKSFNGEVGHFQTSLKCHQREGERCEVCSNIIIKDRCGGRGTYYCPTCERLDKNKKIYAITGTFSSGKSTSLKIIHDMGFDTFSCDEIYNDLFLNSKELKRELKKNLGVTTKEEIKSLCFSSKEKNNILMNITHKYVMKDLFSKIDESKSNIIFVEVPLLFEGGFEKTFDKNIVIYESDEVRDKLVKAKGFTKEEAIKRFEAQMSRDEKREKSDYVVYNNGTIEDLRSNINELLSKMGVR